MYHHLSVFLFIFLINSDSCYSGIFNLDTYKQCRYVKYTNRSICAALYEKDSCDGQKWVLLDTKGAIFNLPSENTKAKSLSVRSGCALQVFTNYNCQGEKFLFIAPQNTYIKNHGNNFAVKTLRDSITYNFCNSYIYKTITRFETFPFR